jgi:putative FmdB family regulatory protein
MPIYEYECESCGKVTEALRSMAQADDKLACEHCKGNKTHRMHSVTAAVAGSGSDSASSLPAMPGCGRCGDPRGACGYKN